MLLIVINTYNLLKFLLPSLLLIYFCFFGCFTVVSKNLLKTASLFLRKQSAVYKAAFLLSYSGLNE